MKAGLVSCSNGQKPERQDEINKLIDCLSEMDIQTERAQHLYAKDGAFGGTAQERAQDLMRFCLDEEIDMIYDVSGGDIANEILAFLDYDAIAKSEKEFWGYSDLTTVINAIYTKTGKSSVLYQVKNLVWDNADMQIRRFHDSVINGGSDLYNIRYELLQGNSMEGIVVGGNIRCFLKLAGTEYFPNMKGKILLLEAFGGEAPQITTYLAQLNHIGVFKEISGVLLGTFTRLEQSGKSAYELLLPYISINLPVAKTSEIGHGSDARAVRIGEYACYIDYKYDRENMRALRKGA